MTTPVHQRKLALEFQASLERQKKVERTGKSFSEELKSQTKNQPHASGSLPKFPHHMTQRKNITVGQAQKLARYAPFIQESAKKNNVPLELVCAVILQESGGNPRAVSHAGAKGLMQLMPQTARRFGVTNSFDAKQNIEGGTKYLGWLLKHFDGNVQLTLAGYNAGEHNVTKYGNRIPPFRETQNYVPSVLGYAMAMVQILRQPPPSGPPSVPGAKMA